MLTEGINQLKEAGDSEAELDARMLLFEAFRMDETQFLLNRTKELTEGPDTVSDVFHYQGMVTCRSRREPLAYILGTRGFMGFDFKVNEQVMVPRQDTETLVEWILEDQTDKDKKILDLCTGSGCIAISLAKRGGYYDVTATDISAEALEVAVANAQSLIPDRDIIRWDIPDLPFPGEREESDDPRFVLKKGDLFKALREDERFDVLVCNPPYIPTAVIRDLEPEVRNYEPLIALDGSEDGLEFYRRIAGEAGDHLNPGACIYLEIGYDQADSVSKLFIDAGFSDIKIIRDLTGLDRVVAAKWRPDGK